jgi:hypothetical protein
MAPTTSPIINPLLQILQMDLGDGCAADAVAVATSARKKQGKKAPGSLKTLKVSNNFGPAGHRNPPRAAKFDGGVREPEFAGGTLSPHKKAQGKEASFLSCPDCKKAFAAAKGGRDVKAKAVTKDKLDDDKGVSVGRPGMGRSSHKKAQGKETSFLYCPNHEKAFAAARGRRDIEAEAVAEDNSDDDKGASVGRPWMGRDPDDPANQAGNGRKTRAIKGGRGATVGASRPKVGQDPDDPADWAGNGLLEARPAKVPPKSGRGAPVKIVNKDGSSGDKVPFTSKDEFASEEGDDEHNPDKDIAAMAQLALGVEGLRPSNKARAAVARLPGAVIVQRLWQRALAAPRNDTDDEASLAATSNSKAAAQVTLRDSMEPDEEANFEANWQAKKGGHTREEADRVTKRKWGGMRRPQVLTADEEGNFKANWQAKKVGYLSGEAGWATKKKKANHAAHQGGGTHSPQVLMALFGSTMGKNQGKTGQGGSTVGFYWPPGRLETPMRRPGCRPRGTTEKPPMQPPRGRPTTRPTRAVERAAPKCRRHCLVPPWAKIRGKLDRA